MQEQDEVCRVTRCTQLTTPRTGLVERAAVAASFKILGDIDRLKPDYRELDDRYSWVTVLHAASAKVPFGSLKVESMYIDSIRWCFLNVVSEDVFDIGTELQRINWCLGLSGVSLQGSSHETLREEEGWNPERERCPLKEPLGDELYSCYQVWDPGTQWLQRGITNCLPLCWYLVVKEPARHALELHGHHYGSLDRLIELVKSALHHLKELIESVDFLANKDAQG